jgi:Arc-like DNA binding domain
MDRRRSPQRKSDLVAKRPQFNARVRPALREQIERAAQKNKRSISEEAESRIERSFLLDQVLGGKYPLMMAAAFTLAGQHAGAFRGLAGDAWQSDPECFETAALALVKELWRQHPGKVKWSWRDWCGRLAGFLGGSYAPLSASWDDMTVKPDMHEVMAARLEREGVAQ